MRSEYSSIVCHRCRQSGAANPWSSLSTTAGTLAGCAPTADISKARAMRAAHSGRWSARAIVEIVRRRSARSSLCPEEHSLAGKAPAAPIIEPAGRAQGAAVDQLRQAAERDLASRPRVLRVRVQRRLKRAGATLLSRLEISDYL